jgi:hypothetical protein
MSDQFERDYSVPPPLPNVSLKHAPLPWWLARRWLHKDEQCIWVRGPRFHPSWERYVTHPALILVTLALAGAVVAIGRLTSPSWDKMPAWVFLVAGGIFIATVYVMALASGYFTRLVVTNLRIFILQGYELCRSWDMDNLPRSMIRYGMWEGRESRSIDLDAVQTMLGSSSEQFTDSKTIRAFGKELDRIKVRKNPYQDPDATLPDD